MLWHNTYKIKKSSPRGYKVGLRPVKTGLSLTGFTLIEMLMVTSMLFVISLAIYATFNNGIKIWQRINVKVPEENLNIFLDKFSRDLRNSFIFAGLNFSGQEEKLEFASLVSSLHLNKRTVGKVIYSYDSGEKTFSRQQKDYAQIYSEESDENIQSLENIKSLNFQYYIYDKEKKEYFWQDGSLDNMPLAVRVVLELDNGTRIIKFIKTVSIPVSS